MRHWHLIIRTPDGQVHVWPVWTEDEEPDESLIHAARTAVGFPASDDWILDQSGWDLQLSLDEPHPMLMRGAVVGAFDELRSVDRAAVDRHVAELVGSRRRVQVDAVKAAYDQLDPDAKAEVTAPRLAGGRRA